MSTTTTATNSASEASRPVAESRQTFTLFSPTAVALLTLVFGAITGCLLLAYNSRQLRRSPSGFLAGGLLGGPLLILVFALLPGFVGLAVNIGLVVLLRNLAQEQQEDVLAIGHNIATRNALIGVGIGVLVLAVVVLATISIVSALPV
ncbi:MAG: hypothetical protein U0232_01255 [Thermomicrobiales bacterium]